MSNNSKQMYEDLIRYGLLKMKNGKLSLKRKGSVTKQQVLTHPDFEMTRRNMAEFGRATKAGRLLREAIRGFGNYDSQMHYRLSSVFSKIIKTDNCNPVGSRSVMRGDINLLKDFQFNKHSNLSTVGFPRLGSQIDPKKGKAVLQVASIASSMFHHWPDNVESVEIDALLVAINFDEGFTEVSKTTSRKIFRNEKNRKEFKLVTEVKETKNCILIHCAAIRPFLAEMNGTLYQMMNRINNPVGIIGVEMRK